MTARITAVYQGGVLKLKTPLDLQEGQVVEVVVDTVSSAASVSPPAVPPGTLPPLTELQVTPEVQEIANRMRAAKTLEEFFEIGAELPDDLPPDYDFCEALNENRRLAGEPLVFDPKLKGISW